MSRNFLGMENHDRTLAKQKSQYFSAATPWFGGRYWHCACDNI